MPPKRKTNDIQQQQPLTANKQKKESPQNDKLCNCRQKYCCPLDGKCLTKCFIYKATVIETNSNSQETYIALAENELKTRFNLHKSSF